MGERERECGEGEVVGLDCQVGVLEGKGLSTLQLWSCFLSQPVSATYYGALAARTAGETGN